MELDIFEKYQLWRLQIHYKMETSQAPAGYFAPKKQILGAFWGRYTTVSANPIHASVVKSTVDGECVSNKCQISVKRTCFLLITVKSGSMTVKAVEFHVHRAGYFQLALFK